MTYEPGDKVRVTPRDKDGKQIGEPWEDEILCPSAYPIGCFLKSTADVPESWLQKIEPELAPCPFCGGSSTIILPHNEEKTIWYGFCDSCEADGPTAATKEGATTRWNTRAAQAEKVCTWRAGSAGELPDTYHTSCGRCYNYGLIPKHCPNPDCDGRVEIP